jgi:putative lipoprotein
LIRARHARVAVAATLALVAACAQPRTPPPAAALNGTITYRERMALPDTARVELQILDVTDEDAEPALVTEKLMETPGQVPIAFTMPYDPHAIDANHTYALRAKIRVGDDLWFASPFDLRVLTAGNPTRADVVLDRISAGGPVGRRDLGVEDPDPPGLDARVRTVREQARAIDARLDRYDMREITEGPTQLRLWVEADRPVKLEVADPSPALRPSSYYFRDGRLFWMRSATGGYAFDGEQLVLRTDGKLMPIDDPGSGTVVLRELGAQLALFGVSP